MFPTVLGCEFLVLEDLASLLQLFPWATENHFSTCEVETISAHRPSNPNTPNYWGFLIVVLEIGPDHPYFLSWDMRKLFLSKIEIVLLFQPQLVFVVSVF